MLISCMVGQVRTSVSRCWVAESISLWEGYRYALSAACPRTHSSNELRDDLALQPLRPRPRIRSEKLDRLRPLNFNEVQRHSSNVLFGLVSIVLRGPLRPVWTWWV